MPSAVEQARAALRRHRVGRLVAAHADGTETRAEDAHFVIDGRSGRLVLSVTRVLLELGEHTLYVPDECAPGDEESLEMLVELAHEPPVPEELRDRHLAYHGHIRGGVWVWARVLSARFGDDLIDGDDLCEINALADCEHRLCRVCNQDSKVRLAVRRLSGGAEGDGATVVGVDGHGVDVRVGHSVRRLEFDEPAGTEERALEQIRCWVGGGRP